jgi:hypothetical protein
LANEGVRHQKPAHSGLFLVQASLADWFVTPHLLTQWNFCFFLLLTSFRLVMSLCCAVLPWTSVRGGCGKLWQVWAGTPSWSSGCIPLLWRPWVCPCWLPTWMRCRHWKGR